MNTDQDNFKNQYINISDIDIYVDYHNKRLKILSHSLLSELIIKEIVDYAKKKTWVKLS